MKIEDYILNPCGSSSLNWHKTKNYKVPDHIRVLHSSNYSAELGGLRYFKLIHEFKSIDEVHLPSGYKFKDINTDETYELAELSNMIEDAYDGERLPLCQMENMINSPLFDESLWIGIVDENGKLVASAISELDISVPECSLDWFQVCFQHRGLGLGRALVLETLRRVKSRALFATVTGTLPAAEKMYRSCGFVGNDYWHIITK